MARRPMSAHLSKVLLSVCGVLMFAAVSAPCSAWNRAGHMLSAAIAYDELARSNPQVIARMMRLMKSHPQAAQFATEIAEIDSTSERAQALFMYMARWSD